jgi:hypothetical protein
MNFQFQYLDVSLLCRFQQRYAAKIFIIGLPKRFVAILCAPLNMPSASTTDMLVPEVFAISHVPHLFF